MKRAVLFVILIIIALLVRPGQALALSVTQSSAAGCKSLFMLDNQGTLAQLFVANIDTPDTAQLYRSKNLDMDVSESRLIQLRSGQFGVIYAKRVDDHTEVKYSPFDATAPISLVWKTADNWRAHFPTVTETSDGTLIAAFSFNLDTEDARVSGPLSRCFYGCTGTKFCCTQDVRAMIRKSTDQGRTWTTITTIDNSNIPVDRRGSLFFPALATGPNDHLYLLVTEQYFDPDVQPPHSRRDTETLWKSTDRGEHWTRINNVFTAPLARYHANEGDLTVEPNGRIVVVFSTNYHPGMSAEEQGDYLLITSSTDDGASWSIPKIVGKFGPNKGEGIIPSLQRIHGNRYGIRFHKYSDPGSSYSYVFSAPNSLSQWSSAYPVNPPDEGSPIINPVCTRDKSSPAADPADLTDTGDTPGDQVNEEDYNVLVAGFGTTYDIFDYNILVGAFGN